MKVLVACEFSGVVRDAFLARGHDAWSCDLLPAPGRHFQTDAIHCAENYDEWDLLIAHPPCTYLASSGARWFKGRREEQTKAAWFAKFLGQMPNIPRIAVENPIGVLSTQWRKPDQIIQPWQFGHGETKATCLWLKGLPLLKPTNIVEGRIARVHLEPPGPDRWKRRSITYQGIADAMAEQWGDSNAKPV